MTGRRWACWLGNNGIKSVKWIVPELTTPFISVVSDVADPVISIRGPYSRAYALGASSAKMPAITKYDASFRIFKVSFMGERFKRGVTLTV